MSGSRGIDRRTVAVMLTVMSLILLSTIALGRDKEYQSFTSWNCGDVGVFAAKQGGINAISETACLGFGTAPFGAGVPCAKCTVTANTLQGGNPTTVPDGTGVTEEYANCGLVLVGTCGFNAGGVRACLNMQFLYNFGDPNPPACSAIPRTTNQSASP